MLFSSRVMYLLTLFMACWLGLSVVMGWWLTCAVTVAALGRISWVAHRDWQAERRVAEARAREEDARIRQTLDMQIEALALCRVLTGQYPAVSAVDTSVRTDN